MTRQSGFAYLFLLFFIALLAISALALGSLQHYAKVRSDEAELLRIGSEFGRALASYRETAVPHVYPASWDDLLLDQRTGTIKRHLRKLYFDPITRRREWGQLIEAGRIVGIHSLSDRVPMKVAGFDPADHALEGAERYSDWVFQPQSAAIKTEQRRKQ